MCRQVPVTDVLACNFRFCIPWTSSNTTTTCCAKWQTSQFPVPRITQLVFGSVKGQFFKGAVYAFIVATFVVPTLPFIARWCVGRRVVKRRALEAQFGANNELALPPVVPTPSPSLTQQLIAYHHGGHGDDDDAAGAAVAGYGATGGMPAAHPATVASV